MNADDIKKAAEERLAELERECAVLRRMLGKDAPAPTVNPPTWVPMPYPVPYIEPYYPGTVVGPYVKPWGQVIYTTGTTTDKIRIGDVSTVTATTLADSALQVSCSCASPEVHSALFESLTGGASATFTTSSSVQ